MANPYAGYQRSSGSDPYAGYAHDGRGASSSSGISSNYGYLQPPELKPLTFTTQKDPDISNAQNMANDYYKSLDPNLQRTQAMAAARDLGIGMTKEARANEARRGVLGTGVSDLNNRQIASDVMSQSLKAGLSAANAGQQMQGSALGQIGSLATAQAGNKQADLSRIADAYQAQQAAAMDQWRTQMQAQALALQQQAQQQQALLGMLNGNLAW
jgi:hypothetical protein